MHLDGLRCLSGIVWPLNRVHKGIFDGEPGERRRFSNPNPEACWKKGLSDEYTSTLMFVFVQRACVLFFCIVIIVIGKIGLQTMLCFCVTKTVFKTFA